jgi:hypothetical protein
MTIQFAYIFESVPYIAQISVKYSQDYADKKENGSVFVLEVFLEEFEEDTHYDT